MSLLPQMWCVIGNHMNVTNSANLPNTENFCVLFFFVHTLFVRCVQSSNSDQKSISDHDRLIGIQKSIFQSDRRFSIIYDQSFHFPRIDFSIFFSVCVIQSLPVATRRFQGFHHTYTDKSQDLNCAIQTSRFIRTCMALRRP